MMSVRLKVPSDEAAPASFCVLGLGDEVHWTSLALLHSLRGQGFRVAGLLPRADDMHLQGGRWRSERVLQLREASSFAFPVSALCPTVQQGKAGDATPAGLDLDGVVDSCTVLKTWTDLVVVDALGMPDSRQARDGSESRETTAVADDMADVALALDLPVVVACNDSEQGLHQACGLVARLRARGLRVLAWVQSGLTPMACAAGLSCVGAIPEADLRDPVRAARHIDVTRLLDVLLSGVHAAAPGVSANAHKTDGRPT